MVRFLLLAALLALAPGAAQAQTDCRTDRLGNVICRSMPTPRAREAPPLAVPPARQPPAYIAPSDRNTFGNLRVRPPRRTGTNPFGTPPRPPQIRHCTTDSFGGVRCR